MFDIRLHLSVCFILLLAVSVLVAPSATAGDYADDWQHQEYEHYPTTSVKQYDMARIPGSDNIGLAFFAWDTDDARWYVDYWVYLDNGVTLGGHIPGVPAQWPCAIALAFSSDGLPAIVFSMNSGGHYDGDAHVYYTHVQPDGAGGYQWSTPITLMSMTDFEYYREVYLLGDAPGRFHSVDIAFDKRPGHVDEAHIVCGGRWLQHSIEEINSGDYEIDEFGALYGLTAPSPGGTWSTPFVFEEEGYPLEDVHVQIPYASLATSAVGPPRLVFSRCQFETQPEFVHYIGYSSYDSVYGTWETPTTLLEGKYASIAMDPYTGNPSVAYFDGLTEGQILFTQYSGASWSVPSLITEAYIGSFPELAIEALPGGGVDTKVAYAYGLTGSTTGMSVYVSEYAGGVWSVMNPDGRVSYEGYHPRIILKPGDATDPWILTTFEVDKLGLADYGELVGGCGTGPMRSSNQAPLSALRALIPLAAALLILLGWATLARVRRYGGRRAS